MPKTKQAALEAEGLISESSDIDAPRDTDVLDRAAWSEGIGAGLGRPPGYLDLPSEVEAAIEDQMRQNAEEAEGDET